MKWNGLTRMALTAGVWLLAWIVMVIFEGQLDLANLSMVLVLASALTAMWVPGWVSWVLSPIAVMAFNWCFVPPKHTFSVELYQNGVLLLALLLVNWIIAGLVIRQRRLADSAHAMASREARLRQWGDTLRDAADPAGQALALRAVLEQATGQSVSVTVQPGLGEPTEQINALHFGVEDEKQRAGLSLCWRDGQALGAGTGRYDEMPDLYLPLRGRGVTMGAALIQGLGLHPQAQELRPHLQALCDQMGSALHRSLIMAQEQKLREAAQLQASRTALLAAISHDYRTPLSTIMGAASSLQAQGDRMLPEQRQRLAAGIVEESERLARLTENTLQLARLDAPAVNLRCDWESAEEMVGAVMRRFRQRPGGQRIRAWVEPDLPFCWCDAMLMSQMLENLIDNALKYSPPEAPVEIHAKLDAEQLVLSVADRGPGIAPEWREKVFEVFERGDMGRSPSDAFADRGAGVGLAVCRAIARAHGGELVLRPRGEGGCLFECRCPLHGKDPTERTKPLLPERAA